MSAAHRWRSPLLGQPRTLELPQGQLEVFVRGEGSALVFAHGWLSNANLWRRVVDRLADRFTCVALDLPLGAHRVPMPDADLTPEGCGALISAAIRELGLDGVTLVGNDSGGAYSQVATAADPGPIARLVLNGCETPYDPFPPAPFERLPELARQPDQLGELFGALRDPGVRRLPAAFGLLAKDELDPEASDSYALPCAEDERIFADAARAMAGASTEEVHAAGRKLIDGFSGRVVFIWSPEDEVFPIANARRYAGALAGADLIEIPDAYSFMAEDQPRAVADALAAL